MFAQYNQQYTNQQSTVVSTGGMIWNGTAWVQPGAAAPTQQLAQSNPTETPAALVAKYTQIYHDWMARMKEYETKVSQLPVMSDERAEVQRHLDWCKYYSDQASRAAHHYHNTPHVSPTFELPPAPPTATASDDNVAATNNPTNTTTAQSTSQPNNKENSSDGGPPESLKRFVHRCLEQCQTPAQKEAAQREAEQVIAKALQEGTLHSLNWDLQPLVTVPGMFPSQQQQQQQQFSKKRKVSVPPGGHHYGPTSSANNVPTAIRGVGYYGSASVSSQPTSHSFYSSQQQQIQASTSMASPYGKYGPQDNTATSASDYMAVPTAVAKQGKKKRKGKNITGNKYVNPESTKYKQTNLLQDGAGFKQSSKALAKRANRFSGPGGNEDVRTATARGIEDRYMGKGIIGGFSKPLDETDYEFMKVKGTCQVLEKQYLRLTAPPKPELVRPLPILKRHLSNLQAEWALGPQSKKRRDYLWFCSEMKALRQDLTVQHIFNTFTCQVYETHARMALQEGDLNEFNQAQTQLKILYDKLRHSCDEAVQHENEFVAYRLIYFVMLTLNQKYKGGSSDMSNLMLSLTARQKTEDLAIQHALQVREAVADVDYHKFFLLCQNCPNLGKMLLNLMVPTVRHWALQRICRAYRPAVEVSFVLSEIGLSVSDQDLEKGKEYLMSCGCVLNDCGSEILAKDTVVRESDLGEKKSLI